MNRIRSTRLLRVADLRQFRDTLSDLACGGAPLAARDRLVVVPTAAAATHLRRAIEDRMLTQHRVVVFPEFVTRDELAAQLAERLPVVPRLLTPFEREVLMAASCRAVADAGAPPPFRLRPGLVAEILEFYDVLRRQEKNVEAFERLTLDALEPNGGFDRGAERLVGQTRFLAAAFRDFERRCDKASALDEHSLRHELRNSPAQRPWTHVVVAVRDRAADPYGLWPCDFDLLARLPGLQRLDVVVTENGLLGCFHERLHQQLPGIEEARMGPDEYVAAGPVVIVSDGGVVQKSRDREEEVASFARWIRRTARRLSPPDLDRIALVVQRPLPYVYLAREVLRSAGVPCQMHDALPLAAEPYAAALDLVFSFVTTDFSRAATVALLRSPHFQGAPDRPAVSGPVIRDLDHALKESRYLGGLEHLKTRVSAWERAEDGSPCAAARVAGVIALHLAQEVSALQEPAPAAVHLDVLLRFLSNHAAPPPADEALRIRHLRAYNAVVGALTSLRDAYGRFDDVAVDCAEVATTVRRWIEAQTFSPHIGDTGVHVVDAASAGYGDFSNVQLAGLVEGEWPERPRPCIFYPGSLLTDLGWPSEAGRVDGAKALFKDLLRLPSEQLVVSSFSLEDESLVAVSPLVDEIEASGLSRLEETFERARVFRFEALALEPVVLTSVDEPARTWGRLRLETEDPRDQRYRGFTSGHMAPAYTLSALERYQDCPFRFFAADVLQLDEPPDEEAWISPRERGRFVHEAFQQFFQAWDRLGQGRVTAKSFDRARALFADVAEPLLGRLPEADAWLERARLFGSAASVGIVDVVLGLEAAGSDQVLERWLEYRLEGQFSLGVEEGRQLSLCGIADRIDLLGGRRLRVIDYKSGTVRNVKRALQVPVYALCAAERLRARDGQSWAIDEAAYVAFAGKPALVPVIKRGDAEAFSTLAAARGRVFEAVAGIERGEFPPRPFDPVICGYCAFPSICRKDYVRDE